MLSPDANSPQPSAARADAAPSVASQAAAAPQASAAAASAFEDRGGTGYDSGPANLTGEPGIDAMLRLEHALKLYGSPL